MVVLQDEVIDLNNIDNIIHETGTKKENILEILYKIQNKYNYLPQEALRRVTQITEINPAEIIGVSSFYSRFRFTPAGKHRIKVCFGTACHIKGAERIFNEFKNYLAIDKNEDTDKDKLFTIEKVSCLGCCMLAPAVQIDDTIYGNVDPANISDIINNFLISEESNKTILNKNDHGSILAEIRICTCASCLAAKADKVYYELLNEQVKMNIPAIVKEVSCTGISFKSPVVEIYFNEGKKYLYGNVKPENVKHILKRHFPIKGIVKKINSTFNDFVTDVYFNKSKDHITKYVIDLDNDPDSIYWKNQMHFLTDKYGMINPLSIDDYINNDGFKSIKKCMDINNPEVVINTLIKSKLRGRGGAGFLTGEKWRLFNNYDSIEKYIICNGDEGDPGAFMDRMILESYPFLIIEGLLIAAYTCRVKKGYVYIRHEYPVAINRMKKAIEACIENGYLGNNIMSKDFSFDLKVVEGAGAFVCGEETALISSIEGKRGTPCYKPPYPVESGLYGMPTLINNVETLANIPLILKDIENKFYNSGTPNSKGTKTFSLAGKIKYGGLIEIPMGTTIGEIVDKIGGGIQNDKKFKAVQIGGPSGGCLPARLSNLKIDFDSLKENRAIMGSGGLIILDETDCMVDIAKYFMSFTQSESCGKCTYCRIGTKIMLDILNRITEGKGTLKDIDELENIGNLIASRSLCGLGKSAPNPVLSTIMHYRDEYIAHINGRCPALKCKSLIRYFITDECIGCTKCRQICPADAVKSIPYEKHEIDNDKCTRCGSCITNCSMKAIICQ